MLVVHFDKKGKPLFMEILRASKIVPLMVEGSAKEEGTVAQIAQHMNHKTNFDNTRIIFFSQGA